METLASANPSGPALPGFLNSAAGPLEHYGYGAIALLLLLENIGVPVIPGEVAMIAGAVFAGTGRAGLNVVLVGVFAVAAAIAGAQIGYLIGKYAGRELVLHYGRWLLIKPRHLDRAEAIVSRYGGVFVVVARFIAGLREANGIIAGITQMRWLTFGFFNVIGACAWVATWVTIGYVAGDHIASVYGDVNRFALYVLIALAVLLAGYVVRRLARRRRHRAATPEDPAVDGDAAAGDVEEDSEVERVSLTEESPAAKSADEDIEGAEEDSEAEGHIETNEDSATRELP
jgi:membrane protein DedA with SNARE-associated domain